MEDVYMFALGAHVSVHRHTLAVAHLHLHAHTCAIDGRMSCMYVVELSGA